MGTRQAVAAALALVLPLAACTGTPSPPAPGRSAAASATASSPSPGALRASADGLGAARIGLPARDFAAALGRSLAPAGGTAMEGCWYRDVAGLDGVALLVLDSVDGAVRRVDVVTPAVRTQAGVGVGSTRSEVTAAYPGVVAEPHKYVAGGSYLIVHAGRHNLLFETDAAGVVTRYRFGEPDPVSWVEGCA